MSIWLKHFCAAAAVTVRKALFSSSRPVAMFMPKAESPLRTASDVSATAALAVQPVKIVRFMLVKEFLCGQPPHPATLQPAAVGAPEIRTFRRSQSCHLPISESKLQRKTRDVSRRSCCQSFLADPHQLACSRLRAHRAMIASHQQHLVALL
ncbi:unnamed protein product [Polarella glacialis]|uniref:Uncharacterized protein n=1 Tax=Polarella glacialis TaxID=89957 RepID=A0A813ER45_POLGL|nr:unnamed protein product [Polarella glacialis]